MNLKNENFSLHITITLFIRSDIIARNHVSLKNTDISRYMLPLEV